MDFNKMYQHLYNWFMVNGPRIAIGVVILFIGFWIIKLIIKIAQNQLHKKQVDPTVKPFLLNLVSTGLRILLVLAVMQFMGIQLTLFTAVVGAFGVAAGLALSGTLQNFASGVLILLLKPFVVGDNIITQGQEGTVTAIRFFYTIVTTFDNRTVIVPNSKLSNEVIINVSRMGTRRLDIQLKFANVVDIAEVKQVIAQSIVKNKQILPSPEYRIGVADIQFDGYVIGVDVWVNAHGFQDTKLAIQETILQDIKQAGIKLTGL